ncbi:hypothetical protein RGU70_17430 [Herbaspirillum sp. RTI4]|uniref:hypothetical protein n=1 Tax=Herbaspirillum sp. RTI4 TaxID=3048640 RepID=UPI002AB472EE|nr:hypothetical protein [Herbaspirillum sp. RTI4]MDY7580094.1 hypothetical protein [Herbaspirillum sp. RTI4]MEA9983125.1 hypothetical protein [Herbaspirillum sp. RTI4]
MKLIATLIATLTLSACSSAPPLSAVPPNVQVASVPSDLLTTGFTRGGLTLVFNKSGQWERITSVSAVTIGSNLIGAADESITVATMKARRQIAEFINTDVKSKRTLTTISTTIQKAEGKTGGEPENNSDDESQTSARIAQMVKDSIVQSSRAILTGTMVESEFIDAEKRQAIVTVFVDRKTAAAALSMSGRAK